MITTKDPPTDYDSPWKEVIEHFFPQFMAFFFPQAFQAIDWSKEYTFLDKEFQKITHDAETGKRYVDKLVQVYLRNGQETWLLIHLEVQGTPETGFAERMFIYHYRIYDQYRRQVVSLAILTDEQSDWRPHSFSYEMFGCRLLLDFPTVKLLDYQHRLAELQQEANPFAVVVLAHLHTQATRRRPQERYAAKLTLIKYLYQRHYSPQEVGELLRFIDWVMTLPLALETQLRADVIKFETEVKMQYVTSFERIAKQQGLERGLQEGMQQGIWGSIINILHARFGDVPEEVERGVPQVTSLEMLWELQRQAVVVESLAAFIQLLQELLPQESSR